MTNAFLFALIVVILLHGIVTVYATRRKTEILEAINHAIEMAVIELRKNAKSTD